MNKSLNIRQKSIQPKRQSSKESNKGNNQVRSCKSLKKKKQQCVYKDQVINMQQHHGKKSSNTFLKNLKNEKNTNIKKLKKIKIQKLQKLEQIKSYGQIKIAKKQVKNQRFNQQQPVQQNSSKKQIKKIGLFEIKRKNKPVFDKLLTKVTNILSQSHLHINDSEKLSRNQLDDCEKNLQTSIAVEQNNPQSRIIINQLSKNEEIKLDQALKLQQRQQQKNKLKQRLQICSSISLSMVFNDDKKANQIEKLKQQLNNYKNQCHSLQTQLRETLQTVKNISTQLEYVNKNKLDNTFPQNEVSNNAIIQQQVYKYPHKQQQKIQKIQKIYQTVNKNNYLNVYQPVHTTLYNNNQTQPNSMSINNQQSRAQTIKQQKESVNLLETKPFHTPVQNKQQIKVAHTVFSTTFTGTTSKVIRLGRDRSYCTRNCAGICNCLCLSHNNQSSQSYGK